MSPSVDFHFGQIRYCIGVPLYSQTVGIFECGSVANGKSGGLRVEINTEVPDDNFKVV